MLKVISLGEAMRRAARGEGRLVDVREPESYRAGHLSGAVNVPFDEENEDGYRFLEDPLYLYCDTGTTSMMAAARLSRAGRDVYGVADGIRYYRGYLEKDS